MKRIFILIFTAALLVVAISGFKTVEKKAVEILDCQLAADVANFKILPGSYYRQGSVSLRVSITNGREEVAAGFKKLELLQIPREGINFRVPLSTRLKSHLNYKVVLAVNSVDADNIDIVWPTLGVRGTCSTDFFEKKFKPITEPSDLRNQLSAATVRKNLR